MPKTDRHRAQKRKNIAVLLVLIALIVLVYAITIMKIAANHPH